MVRALTRVGRKLYVGYGDLNANTGPIHALALDLDTLTVTDEATFTTEQTGAYRPAGGVVYVPFLDPQGGITDVGNGSYAVLTDGAWTTVATVTPYTTHVEDVAVTAGGIFLCGAADTGTDSYSQVWQSTDGGATWTTHIPQLITGSGHALRLYPFSSGKIVTYQIDLNVYCWNGAAWSIQRAYNPADLTDIPSADDTARRFVYNGTEVYLSHYGVVVDPDATLDRSTVYAAFNLTQARSLDVSADGQHLYAHTFAGDVIRYDHAGSATTVLTGQPTAPTAFAVDEVGGFVYYGTSDSRILRTAIT